MTISEKLAKLEELLETEEGALTKDTLLEELDTWDSMSRLSLMVLMQEEFGVNLSGVQINKFIRIQDILNVMEN